MTTDLRKPMALGREADYLGVLGTELRNLLGYSTLAYELVQNAEDSESATSITFSVRPEALIVDNDGTFSDCGAVENDECPWMLKTGTQAHRCDFHSFRVVGSGDKRLREHAIGAFGIGFTAVYQITDRPELISAGRHWILHEEAHAQERIKVCPGCTGCRSSELPGTRIVLPWAFDPESPLRKRLRVDAVSSSVCFEVAEELRRTIPTAILFLTNVEHATILQDDTVVGNWSRLLQGGSLQIHDGTRGAVWHILQGTFTAEALKLRQQHGDRIEQKRSDVVTLAIPVDSIDSGVFCAYLPTQQRTELPFHINADFFPKSDRKEIILDSGYQAVWNRAAIAAAADILAKNITALRDKLGHRRIWRIIEAADRIGRDAENGRCDQSCGYFRAQLAEVLAKSPIVFSSTNDWLCGRDVLYLEKEEEETCLSVLEGLGLRVVHKDLRFAQNLLLSKQVGVRRLDAAELASALRQAKVDRRTKVQNLPVCLRDADARKLLWGEVAILLEQARRRDPSKAPELVDQLASCVIAPALDGDFWPCRQVFRADPNTVNLFQPLLHDIAFLSEHYLTVDVFQSLCPEFDAVAAIEALSRLGAEHLRASLKPAVLRDLITWFERRVGEFQKDLRLKDRLGNLPVFPSTSGPRTLSELVLPGDFNDPLGLADVIDLTLLGGHRDFLRELGARELTFEVYAHDQVPRSLAEGNVTPTQRRDLIRLLASGLGRIQDDFETLDALASVAIVECADGVFRQPGCVYFASKTIEDVLGQAASLAVIPQEHSSAVNNFYAWLGVAVEPRLADVFARIHALTTKPPDLATINGVRIVFSHLGDRVHSKDTHGELAILKTETWLPARGENRNWHRPSDLFADFNAYLFESQAQFLDIPQRSQQAAAEFLTFLGVRTTPTESQVVSHLLYSADNSTPVNREVYRWLNDRPHHPALTRLEGQRCLMVHENGTYLRPNDVFWQPHNFGRLRHQLESGLRKYNDLLARLDVKETPDWSDAIAVLSELAEGHGAQNRRIDSESQGIVLACWQMLDQALDRGDIESSQLQNLGDRKVLCGPNDVLCQPKFVYFDDRPGLAEKFKSFLQNSVIKRPLGAWRAMAAAGVQSLSTAVESQLVEKPDPVEDVEIVTRAADRQQLLARVLDFYRPGLANSLVHLSGLRCVVARNLVVIYTVAAYGREIQSEPERIQAHYLPADHTLYFVLRDGMFSWTAIARELATVLCPEDEPGHLTAAIRTVLAAESISIAKAELDESAIPELAEAVQVNSSAAAPISEFGLETQPPDSAFKIPDAPPSGEAALQVANPLTTGQAIELLLGANNSRPSDPPAELSMPDRPTTTGGPGTATSLPSGNGAPGTGTHPGDIGDGTNPSSGGSGTRRHPSPGPRSGYAVLRSYVMPDRPAGASPADDDGNTHRSDTAQAGVNRVLDFERKHGRNPKEMPPRNEGYDIQSAGADAEIQRFIEVKSLSGDWRGPDAGLTKPEFKAATAYGDRYWLYIVERALQDDYCIHCIQNPAGKANQFLFDPGWKQVAEETDISEISTKETA